MTTGNAKLGNALRDARKDRNMSASDVAKRLKITIPMLRKYERGEEPIPPERFSAMKKIFPDLKDGAEDTELNAREPVIKLPNGTTLNLDAVNRTIRALEILGPSVVRTILDALGGLKTQEKKDYYAKLNERERARLCLDHLQSFDRGRGITLKVDATVLQDISVLHSGLSGEHFSRLIEMLEAAERSDLTLREVLGLLQEI